MFRWNSVRFMYGLVMVVLSVFVYFQILLFSVVPLTLCSRVSLQVFREADSSILEIMKVDVVSFIYIPVQV